MSKVLTDGLSRLQTQSRIPAATWRQWCNLLKIEAEEAVDVWEEICYPIMVATRKMPEVTYILQLRAERLTPDIFEFKEEIAKVLHFFTFLYNLQDEVLSRGKLKTALLKFYKHVTNRIPDTHSPAVFIERFTVELCLLVLVAKILKGANVSLGGVLKTVGEGRGTLDQVVRLAAKNLLDEVWAGALVKAEAEAQEIREIMREEGATHELREWDWWHYAEKARAALYDLDEDEVKAYLSLDNVLRAQFAVAQRLFGVTFAILAATATSSAPPYASVA